LVLRQLAEHAHAVGWDAYTPAAITRVRLRHQPPYVLSDDEVRRLFAAVDSQPMSSYSNKAMVDPVLFRVLYGAGLRVSEALNLTLADVDPGAGTLRIRDSKNGESRTIPITGRLAATLDAYTTAAHPAPEHSDNVFYSRARGKPINQATVYTRFRGYLADAGIAHFVGGPHPHSLRHGFAVANLRRWARGGADLAVMLALPGLLYGPRGSSRHPVLPEADRGRLPRGDGQSPTPLRLCHPRSAKGRVVNPRPVSPPDLAGRPLAKFFTDYLAGERAASPRTVASYRDAMKLLLTWFKDTQRIAPEKLRLADIDRTRVLGLVGGRAGLLGGHPQPAPCGDQVVLPL
jgi:site-specific recombinase XerD